MPVPKVQTGLRIDEPLYDKLKALSEQERRSINNFVEFIIQKYLDDYELANGSILQNEDK